MWYEIICPFEGPSQEGAQFSMFLEWNGEWDEHLIWEHILEHENKIEAFYEHSWAEEAVREVGDVSPEEIMERVGDPFKPDYALFQDGRVYELQYIGECRWVDE